jgi:hypothetical protein
MNPEVTIIPDTALKDLLATASLAFIGTVTATRSSSMANVPVDERTVVVAVRQTLKVPRMLATATGSTITVQLSPELPALSQGESAAFFTEPWAYGNDVAVRELGRLPVDDAAESIVLAAGDGKRLEVQSILGELAQEEIVAHAHDADAIVRGDVVSLEATPSAQIAREHDPHWWVATIAADLVEKGDVSLKDGADGVVLIRVLYANSLDRAWYEAPKPKAGQSGLWLLHRTDTSMAEIAPFQMLHQIDMQPSLQLELIRNQRQ